MDLAAFGPDASAYRTIANRYWQRLMGKGLVDPVDEMDIEPWSQKLLDWLAADLIDHDYDLKYLMSSILRSSTYQLISVGLSAEQVATPTDEFVFTGPLRKRLTAEQFADALAHLAAPVYSSVAFDPFDSQIADASWVWFDAREDGRPAFAPPGQYHLRHTFELPADRNVEEARLLVTADERPCSTIEKQVGIDEIHQTIYHAMGISSETNYVIEGRPFYTTPDGDEKPSMSSLREWS